MVQGVNFLKNISGKCLQAYINGKRIPIHIKWRFYFKNIHRFYVKSKKIKGSSNNIHIFHQIFKRRTSSKYMSERVRDCSKGEKIVVVDFYGLSSLMYYNYNLYWIYNIFFFNFTFLSTKELQLIFVCDKLYSFILVNYYICVFYSLTLLQYLRGGLGDCFFGYIYLMEASTPFVSVRGILSKVGLKQSNLYIINGLVMLATFFLCRVAMFPYVIYLYAESVNLDFVTVSYE